jgi:DNA mismatch endonuclease (patch repair protein)
MSRIRGKDTTPEKIVRSLLHKMGYRFRLHVRIPIESSSSSSSSSSSFSPFAKSALSAKSAVKRKTPKSVSVDILLPKHRVAIFVHGCFWHRHKGCKNCTTPTNRREWWLAKLNGNAARDKVHQGAMRKLGWHTIAVWECQTDRTSQSGNSGR